MTLGNMRGLGVHHLIAYCLNDGCCPLSGELLTMQRLRVRSYSVEGPDPAWAAAIWGGKAMPSAKSVDSGVRKAVEGISVAYKEHFNKQDADGVAGVFTKDGVLIAQSPEGLVNSGTKAIVQRYKGLFKSGFTKMNTKVDQVAQLGDDVATAWGDYEFIGPTKIAGTWSGTYVRDAGIWKCRLLNGIPKSEAKK
jgi:uncharacterized protein (TIGR02246 family)